MASGTGRQYNDPYGDHQYGSGSNTPVPVYTTGYNDAPYQPYDDKDGGYRGGGAVQYGRGYGGQQEELMKDQYPLHHGDMGERLHPNQADQYGYDNPYTRSGASDGGHGTVASSLGPWDSASQRSIASSSVPSQQQPQHLRNKPSYAGGLSYIDEEGAYYRSNTQRPASEIEMRGLVNDPSPMAGRHQLDGRDQDDVEFRGIKGNDYDTSPMAYPPNQTPMYKQPSGVQSWLLFPTGLDRVLAIFGVKMGKLPLEQEIERKRRGIPGQRFPVAVWTLTIIMACLMIYELVRNKQLTGSVIATSPQFNYMIGPSSEVLINIGARFIPCMKLVPALPPSFDLSCYSTDNPPTSTCSIEEICVHGGFSGGEPDQTWRFFVPIFLHVGIVHFLLNMVAQVYAGGQIEREMGTVPFLIVYFAGGLFGNILGGNFSRVGIPSVGASGALVAVNACVAVDLALHWKYEERPKLKAFLLTVEFAIIIAIGYIPNAVDGLAHLGGFAMGILAGTILYPSISESKKKKFALWGVRIVALVLIIVAFALTTKNFYTDDPNAACPWCRFLSCIPTSSNDRCRGTGITITQTTQNTRRSWDLL